MTLIQEKINCLWDRKECKISFSKINKNFLRHLTAEMEYKQNPYLCDILTFFGLLYTNKKWGKMWAKWKICTKIASQQPLYNFYFLL